jgi:hypothetical protein
MLQFSLRNLLIAVAAVAVGTAALLNANEWWASLLWGAALVMLVFAGLVALYRRDGQRAFWSGYLVAGSLYLLLLMYSVPSATGSSTPYTALNHYRLFTTRVILWTYSWFPDSKRSQYLPSPPLPAGGIGGSSLSGGGAAGMMPGMSGVPGMPGGMGMPPPPALNPSYVDQESFLEVGHALWMLFLSWLGGTVAFCLYRTRENATTAAASTRGASV